MLKLVSLQGANITWNKAPDSGSWVKFRDSDFVEDHDSGFKLCYFNYGCSDISGFVNNNGGIVIEPGDPSYIGVYDGVNLNRATDSQALYISYPSHNSITLTNLQPNDKTPTGLLENPAFIGLIQEFCTIKGGVWEDVKVPIERIYNDAADKNVATAVVYANGGKIYFEEAFENQVDKAELENLFVKGLVVIYEGKNFKPVYSAVQGNKAVVAITVGANSVVELASAEEVTE